MGFDEVWLIFSFYKVLEAHLKKPMIWEMNIVFKMENYITYLEWTMAMVAEETLLTKQVEKCCSPDFRIKKKNK